MKSPVCVCVCVCLQTTDVELYLDVVGRIDGRLGPDYEKDMCAGPH